MASLQGPVPEWLTATYMEQILKPLNFRVQEIKVSPGSKVGDGYCSQILRINVIGVDKSISVIGKLKVDSTFTQKLDDKGDVFVTEIKFFSTLLPILHEIRSLDFVPEYYGTDLQRNIIFMEDLVSKGHGLVPRGQYLDRDHCQLTIEALATFHGASYYALGKDPSLKEKFTNFYWTRVKDESTYTLFVNGFQTIQDNIEKYGLSESHKKKLLAIKEKVDTEWFKVMEPKEGQLNFLLHGDCWANNSMYHYKDGKVDSFKLLDYQLVNYGCFANDLMCFLYCSAHIKVLINDLDFLLDKYWNKLRNVAPDIPDLTLERVKSDFADKYFSALLMTLVFRPYCNVENPPHPDVLFEGANDLTGYNDPKFIADMQQLLPFFENHGVF